jgi:hypothetical protein
MGAGLMVLTWLLLSLTEVRAPKSLALSCGGGLRLLRLLKEEEERKGCYYYDSLSSLSSSIMGRI